MTTISLTAPANISAIWRAAWSLPYVFNLNATIKRELERDSGRLSDSTSDKIQIIVVGTPGFGLLV
jgi:hypothetical protein